MTHINDVQCARIIILDDMMRLWFDIHNQLVRQTITKKTAHSKGVLMQKRVFGRFIWCTCGWTACTWQRPKTPKGQWRRAEIENGNLWNKDMTCWKKWAVPKTLAVYLGRFAVGSHPQSKSRTSLRILSTFLVSHGRGWSLIFARQNLHSRL